MAFVRQLLAQRHFAILLCAAVLALKLIVPTGYMIDAGPGRFAIVVCSGLTPPPAPMTMHGMEDMHGDMPDHGKSNDHDKAEMPCAFAGVSAAMLGAIDPILFVAFIAFLIAFGLRRSHVLAPPRVRYLRPPLRGPPTHL